MSGLTLQKIDKIKDSAKVIKKRLEEEKDAKPLAYGSIKVSELAELLGGAARRPYFIGTGWDGAPDKGIDPTDPCAVARALETGARANTRVRAYGVILTMPKGASLLAAFDQDDPEQMQRILMEMAEEYMRVLEKDLVVRFGNGGYDKVPVRGLKAWAVIHAASAGGDPHFHVHLLISATAETIDGRKGQIDGDKLLGETARLADGSSKRIMAQRLEEMGYGIGLDGDVVGVDKELIERASTARNAVQAIRTFFASKGIALSDKAAWDHWRQVAEGRPDKELSESLLESIGSARGEKLGGEAIERAIDEAFSYPDRRAALKDWFGLKYQIPDWETLGNKAREAWEKYPLYDDITKVVALMAMLPTPPTPASVEALCARFVDDDHRADLMDRVGKDPRVLKGKKHWALTAQLVRERKIQEQTEKLIQKDCAELGIHDLLADEELPLCVIQGVAGAGKSEALRSVSKTWANEGKTVWAVARNRLTATDTGSAAGASRSHTLSSYALREKVARSKGPRPGDILVVDEFGLLDHGDVELVLSLAEKDIRVKALGDSHQIQPIDSSTSARLVTDVARRHNMVSLDHSRRCEPWQALHDSLREVVTGDGDPKKILESLDIHVIKSPGEAVEIAKGYQGAEMVVQSNDMRCDITEHLQRPARPKHLAQVFMTKDGTAAWAGDKVVVRRNITATSRSGEAVWLYNGQRARVAQVSRKEVILLTDTDLVKISHESAQEALSLGGVWTGDSAQGQTWERAVVVLTGTETREWLYSAVTRGRNAPVIVVLSDDGEYPRSIVEAVLLREGMAKTVDELCKKDAELAKSVREAEARWSRSQTGDRTSPEAAKPQQLRIPFDEPMEKAGSKRDTGGEDARVDASQRRNYLGGFFYKEDDGAWQADAAKRGELLRLERKKAGLGNSWGGRRKEAKIAEPFRVDRRREITPGSGEFYDPVLDPSNDAYLPGLSKELRDSQCDRVGRIYKGGFFYKGEDEIWRVDFQKREEFRWEAKEIPLRYENPKKRRSAAAKVFDITHTRPVEYGNDEEIYDPNLDDYAIQLNAARKAKAAKLQAEVEADVKAGVESELSLSRTFSYGLAHGSESGQTDEPYSDRPDEPGHPVEAPHREMETEQAERGYRLRL